MKEIVKKNYPFWILNTIRFYWWKWWGYTPLYMKPMTNEIVYVKRSELDALM